METTIRIRRLFHPLVISLGFFRRHILLVLALGLIAAIGRVIQLEGFGPVSRTASVVLEIVIESSRVLIVLFTLGITRIVNGMKRIAALFNRKSQRMDKATIFRSVRDKGVPLLCSLIGFALIAALCNFLIDQLARETCLLLTLKNRGVLTAGSSEWTILLFFKNLSVIPFTLIFESVLLLWLTGKVSTDQHIPAGS